jgi:hypothetical protein
LNGVLALVSRHLILVAEHLFDVHRFLGLGVKGRRGVGWRR